MASDADTRAFKSVSIRRGGQPLGQIQILGVTFGLLVSKDSGATWQWVCEVPLGITGIFDPDYAVMEDGTIFSASLNGLRRSTDGCTWTNAPLGAPFASTIDVHGSTILAAASDVTDSRIYRSTNAGASFAVASTPCSALVDPQRCGSEDWWKNIRIAPSDPDRVYLSGHVFIANPACVSDCDCAAGQCPTLVKRQVLFRSDDGGDSWTELDTSALALTGQSDLFVAAISPTNPNEVYVRISQAVLNEPSDVIYKSTNGGDTFAVFLDLSAPAIRRLAPAMLARANGDVWIGTSDGLYIGYGGAVPSATPVSEQATLCLGEAGDGGVYGCSDDFGPEMAALARTEDGVAWTKVLRYGEITGPVACDAGTEQRDVCEDLQWCNYVTQFSIADDRCAADGGPDGPITPEDKPTCGCASADPSSVAMVVALALAGGWLGRRRRDA